jgi:hypothetical protein
MITHQRFDAREAGDDARARRGHLLVAGAERLAVVDEGADLEGARARVDERVHALARRELALLVHALDVLGAPAAMHFLAARRELLFARTDRAGVLFEAAIVEDLAARLADGDEGDVGHGQDPSGATSMEIWWRPARCSTSMTAMTRA